MDMQYMQFHPTALYEKGKSNLFLISEAVRGFGGYIVNSKGRRFLFDCDSRGELATRDLLSEAITNEINQKNRMCIWMCVIWIRKISKITFQLFSIGSWRVDTILQVI